MKGRHLIYLDESTFNLWQVPTRAWVRKDSMLTMPSNRGRSMTVIAAISEQQGIIHYSIFHGSNNADSFAKFATEMIKKIRAQATVYMDNYMVHQTQRVKDLFTDRVEQRFLPP